MADDRLATALDRIERALARLERRAPEAGLEVRHARLKAAAQDALAGLDRLLEPQR